MINLKVEFGGAGRTMWNWFLAGFAGTLGFAAARGLLLWLGWWR